MVETARLVSESGVDFIVPCQVGKTSDGYHSFDELYEHRHLLFALALRGYTQFNSWRSRLHEGGDSYENWFIAGLELPTGAIRYHLPNSMWALLEGITTLDRAPKWDGKGSEVSVERMTEFLKQPQNTPQVEYVLSVNQYAELVEAATSGNLDRVVEILKEED